MRVGKVRYPHLTGTEAFRKRRPMLSFNWFYSVYEMKASTFLRLYYSSSEACTKRDFDEVMLRLKLLLENQ
jgi:hypothetical protein